MSDGRDPADLYADGAVGLARIEADRDARRLLRIVLDIGDVNALVRGTLPFDLAILPADAAVVGFVIRQDFNPSMLELIVRSDRFEPVLPYELIPEAVCHRRGKDGRVEPSRPEWFTPTPPLEPRAYDIPSRAQLEADSMVYNCDVMQVINYADGYMIGIRRVELPFAPTGEIELSGILYRPGDREPLESEAPRVVYDFESKTFILLMSVDNRPDIEKARMEYAVSTYHPDFRWKDYPEQGEWIG